MFLIAMVAPDLGGTGPDAGSRCPESTRGESAAPCRTVRRRTCARTVRGDGSDRVRVPGAPRPDGGCSPRRHRSPRTPVLLAGIPFQGKRICQGSDSPMLRPLASPALHVRQGPRTDPRHLGQLLQRQPRRAPMTAQHLPETQTSSDAKNDTKRAAAATYECLLSAAAEAPGSPMPLGQGPAGVAFPIGGLRDVTGASGAWLPVSSSHLSSHLSAQRSPS